MTDASENSNPSARMGERDQEIAQIRDALRGLRFGSVNVIVQDGVVVQIDRTEKRRTRRNGVTNENSSCR
ncbi:MAG: YezD family protein [Pirellulales bacterium]|nr:YezD family protein [Pirellulales bacterium]